MRILALLVLFFAVAGRASGSVTPTAAAHQRSSADRSSSGKLARVAWVGLPAPRYRVVWSFLGGPNGPHGASPQAGLVSFNGRLYGTTLEGGQGGGIVFSLTPAGKETLLHDFSAIYSDSPDGNEPQTDLIVGGSTLYGTTVWGGGSGCGGSGCGTVYKLERTGVETTLYRFKGGTDGSFPSTLLDIGGALYGTTSNGGGPNVNCDGGCGTVFKLAANGAQCIIYRFKGLADGALPAAGLVELNGALYGTTDIGGAYGYGTVFEINAAGRKRIVHDFGGGFDGIFPAGLTVVNGRLFGLTSGGGTQCPGAGGCGTVFEVNPAGGERIVYSFRGGLDGAVPQVALTAANGELFGVTHDGGRYGAGTIFRIAANGVESVVHSFSFADGGGALPQADLVYAGGQLYGTTSQGGAYGFGTAFALTP